MFAAANVGTGDTIWTTLGPAALGTAALAGVALAHAAASGLSEAVTVDRDPAAAVRAVGLHLAVASLLARAVAGDWVSVDATLADLARRGWPAVPLAGCGDRRRPLDGPPAVGPPPGCGAGRGRRRGLPRRRGDPMTPLRAGPVVADAAAVRRRLALDHAKWDPQVGDVASVAPFPTLLQRSHWLQLARLAESLAAELAAAEAELLTRPDLLRRLGLPRRLRRAVRPPPPTPRLVRFDFHWTTDGWRISEANADVPGGLCESSALPALIGGPAAGDPAAAWPDAVAAAAVAPDIALLTAPGFMEDHQVMAHLAGRPAGPRVPARTWPGRATCGGPPTAGRRWTPPSPPDRWGRSCGSSRPSGCRGGRAGGTSSARRPVPVLNPAAAAVVESKRFPLTWAGLRTPLPTWRALLPETVDPRAVPWRRDADAWLLKTAYCNTGDTVAAAGWGDGQRWPAAAPFGVAAARPVGRPAAVRGRADRHAGGPAGAVRRRLHGRRPGRRGVRPAVRRPRRRLRRRGRGRPPG